MHSHSRQFCISRFLFSLHDTMMHNIRPLRSGAQRLAFTPRHPSRLSPVRALQSLTRPQQPRNTPLVPLLLTRSKFSTKPPALPNKRSIEEEKSLAQQTLESSPADVTTTSSIPGFVEGSNAQKDTSNKASELVSDVHTIQETLALKNVPKEPYILGISGTIPYMATSLSTVYLAWNINTEPTQSTILNSILLSKETATHWLHLLEPVQVGYGAVIISFLGAIHWGLEYAEKTPSRARTRFRYGMGVVAPMLAWPTVFMPVEWALITQFLSFTGLYLADLRATTRAWTPTWYSNYRFVLTAIVGAAIFVSLVGRAKVGQGHTKLTAPELRERLGLDEKYDGHNWEKEEAEEKERIRKEKKEEEKRKAEEEQKKKAEELKAQARGKSKAGDEKEKGKEPKESEKDKKE